MDANGNVISAKLNIGFQEEDAQPATLDEGADYEENRAVKNMGGASSPPPGPRVDLSDSNVFLIDGSPDGYVGVVAFVYNGKMQYRWVDKTGRYSDSGPTDVTVDETTGTLSFTHSDGTPAVTFTQRQKFNTPLEISDSGKVDTITHVSAETGVLIYGADGSISSLYYDSIAGTYYMATGTVGDDGSFTRTGHPTPVRDFSDDGANPPVYKLTSNGTDYYFDPQELPEDAVTSEQQAARAQWNSREADRDTLYTDGKGRPYIDLKKGGETRGLYIKAFNGGTDEYMDTVSSYLLGGDAKRFSEMSTEDQEYFLMILEDLGYIEVKWNSEDGTYEITITEDGKQLFSDAGGNSDRFF